MKLFGTVLCGATVALGLMLLTAQPRPVSADHAVYNPGSFQQHFNHTNQVPGFPPGAVRAVVVCNELPQGSLSSALRDAAGLWNGAGGAAFQAFWIYGPNEFFGPCPPQIHIRARIGSSAECGSGAVACFGGPGDAYGFFETTSLIWVTGGFGNADGLRAAMAHELGHALGLDEQYVHSPAACGPGLPSIMDALAVNDDLIIGGCDATGPTTVDSARVRDAFSLGSSQSAPPTPQVVRTLHGDNGGFSVVFKAANAAGYSYERALCGSITASQSVTFPYASNPHIVRAYIPYATDGRTICYQMKTTIGGPSAGFHAARRVTFGRTFTARLTNLYAQSTEQGGFWNASTVAVDFQIRNGNEVQGARWFDPNNVFLVCHSQAGPNTGGACLNELGDLHPPAVFLYRELFWHRLAVGGLDTDFDGCTDGQETGFDPTVGGDRDLQSPWDFYDTPDLAVTGAGSGARDRSITLDDTLRILDWFGVGTASPEWTRDINGNGVPDGEEFSRAAGPPDKPWRTVPANDGIDITDASVNLESFGHTC